jgi:hypothetical protein
MAGYKIVWHKVFLYQYQNLRNNSLLKRQVDKQLEVIKVNQERAGAPLRYLPPDLAGKIRKLRVGGAKRHRMFIKVDDQKAEIRIGFVDPRRRGQLDYEDLPLDIFALPENEIDEKRLRKFLLK